MDKEHNGSVLGLIVLATIAYFFFFSGETWIAFYYPNQNDLTVHKQSDELGSYEECLFWIESAAGYNTNYDYECGKSCKFNKGYNLYVCKETIK